MITTAAAQVAAAIDARSRDGVALVAVDGMGGSGKSALAAALVELCGAVVVHGDDLGVVVVEGVYTARPNSESSGPRERRTSSPPPRPGANVRRSVRPSSR